MIGTGVADVRLEKKKDFYNCFQFRLQRPRAKIIIKPIGTGIPVSRFGKITASVRVFGGGYFFTLIVMRILQKEIVTRIIVSPPFGLTPSPFWDGLALRSANRFSLVLLVSSLYHRF